MKEKFEISPEVAMSELEHLAEFWRNRALGHAQLSYMKDIRIKQLEELIPKEEVVKTGDLDNGN